MSVLPYYWNQLSEAWQDPSYVKSERLQDKFYWDRYIKNGALFDNITLSREQMAVVQQKDKYLLISGSAGSGKSITLLGRMFRTIAEERAGQRILYVTFNPTLIEDARKRCYQSPVFRDLREKHTIHLLTYHDMAVKLLQDANIKNVPRLKTSIVNLNYKTDAVYPRTEAFLNNYERSEEYQALPRERQLYQTHFNGFLRDEILWMKGNGYITEESYLNCERTGRGINPRLTKEQRRTVFTVFQGYHRFREKQWGDDYDPEDYALLLLKHMDEVPDALKYDYIYVDEMQDFQPMQILSLTRLVQKSITLSGDQKQRIYRRSALSLKDLGIELEGRRSRRLKVNYRSTKQIMKLARAIPFMDTDHDREDDHVFVREGPKPEIRFYSSTATLNKYLVKYMHEIRQHHPEASMAVIHRHDGNAYNAQNCRIRAAMAREFEIIGVDSYAKRFDYEKTRKPIFYTDAYSIKGLEFDYVFVIHFDRFHYPHQHKIEELEKRCSDKWSDSYNQDFELINNEEKKILYVALSRARQKVVLLSCGKDEKSLSPYMRLFPGRDYENFGFNKSMFSK